MVHATIKNSILGLTLGIRFLIHMTKNSFRNKKNYGSVVQQKNRKCQSVLKKLCLRHNQNFFYDNEISNWWTDYFDLNLLLILKKR